MKESFRKNIPLYLTFFYVSLLTILSIFSVRDLFSPGYFESHDGVIHLMRLMHFDEALRSGVFPVRWVTTWMGGFGSPVFIYIWQLPYYLGSFFHAVGFNYAESLKIIFILSMVLSGYTAYLFLYELTGKSEAAFLGSFLYVWAPYRFIDIFIRGAIGEACSFVFFPLLLWEVLRALRKKEGVSLRVALWWTALILTHNIMAAVMMGIYLLYVFFAFAKSARPIHFLFSALLTIVLGLAMSSWYWVPALAEKNYVRLDHYLSSSYQQQFVPAMALINSPWKYSYAAPQHQDYSMSFQIGVIHIIGLVVSVSAMIIGIIFRRVRREASLSHLIFFIVLAGVSLLLITTPGQWFYSIFPQISVLNYPWRLLEVVIFAISISCGIWSAILKGYMRVILVVMVVISVIFFYFPFAQLITWDIEMSEPELRNSVRTNTNFLPDTEFLPASISFHTFLDEYGKASDHNFFESLESKDVLQEQKVGYTHYRLNYSFSSPTQIRIQQFFFPGWKGYIDGQEVEIQKDQQQLMRINIPKGNHQFDLIFAGTNTQKISLLVSFFSFIFFSVLIICKVLKLMLYGLRKNDVF